MRAKELTRLELTLSHIFSYLDESKKATKPTLTANTRSIPSCSHNTDESQIALALSWSYLTRMRAKELTRLELALSSEEKF
jgi:hypothetical protein